MAKHLGSGFLVHPQIDGRRCFSINRILIQTCQIHIFKRPDEQITIEGGPEFIAIFERFDLSVIKVGRPSKILVKNSLPVDPFGDPFWIRKNRCLSFRLFEKN